MMVLLLIIDIMDDEGSGAELVGPADSRAGQWVRGAGKDGTTELLRGGGTSLFF